jgi:integrase
LAALGHVINLPIVFPELGRRGSEQEADLKFTKPLVASLALPTGKTGKTEAIYFDSELPGFGVRLREGGSKVFIFQYKIGNKHRRITLGRCSALELTEARKQAGALHAKVRLGEDPAAVKAENRSRAEETFGQCVKTFLAWQRGQVRHSSFKDIERHLSKHLVPLHGLHIGKIDKRAIAAQLSRIATRAPTQANRARASLSCFLNWAAGEGLVETNAALHTNKAEESEPRDRHLSNAEIHALWHALPAGDFGDILKLLLLTGQREREISELRWGEVDFESWEKKEPDGRVIKLAPHGVIRLPKERTKNGRSHAIPMSPMVRAILEARPRQDRALVFGNGAGGFSGWSKAKARLDAAVKIPDWRIHDLRRTCATGMADLGVQPHIIEACLNHVSGHKAGVAGIYNRSTYEPEKATALTIWADHVAAVIGGRKSKVTALRKSS